MSDKESFKKKLAHKAKVGAVVGSAATVFIAGANGVKKINQSVDDIINKSTQATNNYINSVASTNDSLTAVVRDNNGSTIEYPFNPHDTLQTLNNAIKIYETLAIRSRYVELLSSKEEENFENVMNIIIESNIKFIEIQTQDIKNQIANALRETSHIDVNPNNINITYNDTNQKVSIEINGNPVENVGSEFENLISEYKQYILTTEFNSWEFFNTYGKMTVADEVIENICNSNQLFETLHNPNSQFQIQEDVNNGYTITSIEFVAGEKEKENENENENDTINTEIATPSIQVSKKLPDGDER